MTPSPLTIFQIGYAPVGAGKSFHIPLQENETTKNPTLVVSFEFDNVVGSAADDLAEFLQCNHGDVLALLQRVKGFVVDAAFQQLILGYIQPLHRLPHGTIIEHRKHPQKSFPTIIIFVVAENKHCGYNHNISVWRSGRWFAFLLDTGMRNGRLCRS